ncbi:ATP phosphoribosyltransferase [Metallosphaera sp. J1]|uniref:ATP phosphoribosyltransferase n=1 Tax=Metallosphaera javensis (ex Hofmann et al. 2022) TaxID=99938 RepID=UPI001EE06B80|nr:ATP phosphoribosyltransferase [Metallosphaera javensis (ex Hofmann et al. 2022)]MCG3108677.1 ATP phosphoribosyltransferase [Metallosphaera javensis (ex Hofmann et al. 2022)]
MKIAIPNKGRLQGPALQFLNSVGIKPLANDDRALMVPTSWEGVQLVTIRTEDIPNIVETGAVDLGITGLDYVMESGADVEELVKLDFGKSKLVLAVPTAWNIEDPRDMPKNVRIATKYHNIARSYLERKGISARLVKISGAAEIMPSLGAADAIIDVTSTGTTLKLHGLKAIDVVSESYALVIGNRNWMKSEEADRINLVLTMMKGALSARGKKMIFMNVDDINLRAVVSSLPAMLAPAISKLSNSNAWEVVTVTDEDMLPEVIAKAKTAGARDIVVVNIEKVIK